MKKENVTASTKDRFNINDCRVTMKAVVTTGNGGYEKLDYRDVPIPKLGSNATIMPQKKLLRKTRNMQENTV